MMYQAGIKHITLIEHTGISWTHYDILDENKISNIESTGAQILIDNWQRPVFDIEMKPNDLGRVGYEYNLEFLLFGYVNENLDTIERLRESIYGWAMLVEYYDETQKFYPFPVWFDESGLKPQDEMSFEVKLQTRVPTMQQHLEYTPGISTIPVYRADTTLLTADSTTYTADYSQ
jgi:hypothetical protein